MCALLRSLAPAAGRDFFFSGLKVFRTSKRPTARRCSAATELPLLLTSARALRIAACTGKRSSSDYTTPSTSLKR